MAHEFESGFFAGRAAWHGLGTVVDKAPTVAEALRVAGIDWTVSTHPVQTVLPDGSIIPAPEARAVVRDTDQSVLGVVGRGFVPLQNRAVADWFQPFVDAGAHLETMGSLRGGRRIWGLARLPGAGDVGNGDSVLPYLLLAHGHDGTLTLRAGLTGIRVVCANTLGGAVRAGKDTMIRVRHTRRATDQLAAARASLAQASGAFAASLDTFRAMRARDLDTKGWREFLKRAVPAAVVAPEQAPDAKTAPTTTDALPAGASLLDAVLAQTPTVAIAPRAWEALTEIFEADTMAGRNLWGAYNAITGWLDHERGSRTADGRLDASWFGVGESMRARALDAACEMMAGARP